MMNSPSLTAPTRQIEVDGIRYAYRRLGQQDGIPLVFLQHVTGTMDHWDPAVVDGFAESRPVILFDNAGVSRSTGVTPKTVAEMATQAAGLLRALDLTRVDLLGFSLGGFVSQMLAADYPELVRRLILAGTGPEGGTGITAVPAVIAQAQREGPGEPRLALFFEPTPSSQAAGRAFLTRQARRTEDRDPDASGPSIAAQFQAIVRWGGGAAADGVARSRRINQPALVVDGKNDLVVPTVNSFALFQEIPDAKLVLYPDSGHGALFQFAASFVEEGLRFLAG